MNTPFFQIGNLHNATAHSLAFIVFLDILKLLDYRLEDRYTASWQG